MKIIKENKKKLKTYVVEYWFQSFLGDDDMGYDFDQVKVEAISPTSAIKKAKVNAPRFAKNYKIIRYFKN